MPCRNHRLRIKAILIGSFAIAALTSHGTSATAVPVVGLVDMVANTGSTILLLAKHHHGWHRRHHGRWARYRSAWPDPPVPPPNGTVAPVYSAPRSSAPQATIPAPPVQSPPSAATLSTPSASSPSAPSANGPMTPRTPLTRNGQRVPENSSGSGGTATPQAPTIEWPDADRRAR